MNSRLLLNIMLLLFALGLVATVLLSKKIEQSLQLLSETDTNSVTQILIQHKHRTSLLEKTETGWHFIQPVKIQANQFRIATLLKLLNAASHAHYPDKTLDLEKYGINEASSRITFDDIEIIFGTTNPVNNLRYVLINHHVHMIDDLYYPLISSQLGTLISHQIVNTDFNISKLDLPDMSLWQDERDMWQSNAELSTDDIIATIQNWKNVQAFAVHDYVERKPLGRISLLNKSTNKDIIFYITDVDPWLIIARPEIGIEYHLTIENYDTLFRPGVNTEIPDELRQDIIEVQSDEFLNVIER